jgi:hypothetical protein
MNLNKLDVKNKNTNLYCIFYIIFIRNQRKNLLPNKYRFRPFSSIIQINLLFQLEQFQKNNSVGSGQGNSGPLNSVQDLV